MKYVALLRGINVGGNNSISMAKLKECFDSLGFKDVKTYINTGNVIFSSTKSETSLVHAIEKCIQDNFGLNVPVVIRTKDHIEKVVEDIPKEWVNDTDMRTDVLFLWDEVDYPTILDEIQVNPDVDHLIYTKGAVIWNYDRINYSKTKLRNFIGTRVYKLMTARNVNTVRKIRDLMQTE